MPKRKQPIEGTDEAVWKTEKDAEQKVSDSVRNSADYLDALKNITILAVDDPLSLKGEKPMRRILTKTALDRILSKKGGIEAGRSLEIYGEFASGKTEIIWTLLAEADGLLVFIDSENTFSADRFKEICLKRGKDINDIAQRFKLFQPRNYKQQDKIVKEELPQFDAEGKLLDIGMVAVDSLMVHWSNEPDFFGRQNLPQRQQLIGSHLYDLKRYAKLHNAVLVYSNQISMKPDAKAFTSYEDIINAQGGPRVAHAGDHRILLRKGPGNIRFARLIDSIELPLMEIPFVLDSAGITDIPNPAERVKAMEIGEKYRNRFLSGQISSQAPAGKEYYKKAIMLGVITASESIQNGWLTEEEAKKAEEDMEKKPLAETEKELEELVQVEQLLSSEKTEEAEV